MTEGLTDNPNYALCDACGGTGWAYIYHDPPLRPTPTMVQHQSVMPCPRCHRGKLVGHKRQL